MSSFVAELARGRGPVRATGIAKPESGSWIVGDVRIDGREQLRDSLGAAGVPTRDDASDIELIFAAWSVWRETATERLIGDFSFALWDSERRVLFCARDQLGVSPLYWAQVGETFVCSNVLDEVRAHPRVSSRLHEPAIVSFLQHGSNENLTTTSFADIRRLAPAHQITVRVDAAALAPARYWSFPVPEPLRLYHEQEYIERFRDVLGDAVRDRLRTDRAAILLSGGLDSTSLAATARRVAPRVRLSAWTQDMAPNAPPDEVRLATSVAERLGIPQQIVNDAPVAWSHLAERGFRTPEPLDEPAWAAWLRLVDRISSDANVLVMGEDGDALLRPPGLLTMLRTWPARDVIGRVARYTLAHRHHPHLGIWWRRRVRNLFGHGRGPTSDWVRTEVLSRTAEDLPRALAHPARPDAVRFLSAPVWQSVLESAQQSYTRAPVAQVWPLLDLRVISFVFSIPPVPWCQKKELLRRSFVGEIPDEVLRRPKSPLHGYFERQVRDWRASQSLDRITLGKFTLEFVDSQSVADTFRNGTVAEVLGAWRVLALDQWLQYHDLAGTA